MDKSKEDLNDYKDTRESLSRESIDRESSCSQIGGSNRNSLDRELMDKAKKTDTSDQSNYEDTEEKEEELDHYVDTENQDQGEPEADAKNLDEYALNQDDNLSDYDLNEAETLAQTKTEANEAETEKPAEKAGGPKARRSVSTDDPALAPVKKGNFFQHDSRGDEEEEAAEEEKATQAVAQEADEKKTDLVDKEIADLVSETKNLSVSGKKSPDLWKHDKFSDKPKRSNNNSNNRERRGPKTGGEDPKPQRPKFNKKGAEASGADEKPERKSSTGDAAKEAAKTASSKGLSLSEYIEQNKVTTTTSEKSQEVNKPERRAPNRNNPRRDATKQSKLASDEFGNEKSGAASSNVEKPKSDLKSRLDFRTRIPTIFDELPEESFANNKNYQRNYNNSQKSDRNFGKNEEKQHRDNIEITASSGSSSRQVSINQNAPKNQFNFNNKGASQDNTYQYSDKFASSKPNRSANSSGDVYSEYLPNEQSGLNRNKKYNTNKSSNSYFNPNASSTSAQINNLNSILNSGNYFNSNSGQQQQQQPAASNSFNDYIDDDYAFFNPNMNFMPVGDDKQNEKIKTQTFSNRNFRNQSSSNQPKSYGMNQSYQQNRANYNQEQSTQFFHTQQQQTYANSQSTTNQLSNYLNTSSQAQKGRAITRSNNNSNEMSQYQNMPELNNDFSPQQYFGNNNNRPNQQNF
jgi:hypothetical protein